MAQVLIGILHLMSAIAESRKDCMLVAGSKCAAGLGFRTPLAQ